MELHTKKELIDACLKAKDLEKESNELCEFFWKYFPMDTLPKPIFTGTQYLYNKRLALLDRDKFFEVNRSYYYYDPLTNKRFGTLGEVIDAFGKKIVITDSSTEKLYKYIPEFDVVVLYYFEADTKVKYQLLDITIYFKKGDEIAYPELTFSYTKSGFHYHPYCHSTSIFKNKFQFSQSAARAFYKMYGFTIVNLHANDYQPIYINDNTSTYFRSNELVPNTGKTQKLINELSAIELPKLDTKKIFKDFHSRKRRSDDRALEHVSVTSIAHVKEGVSVIRWTNCSMITNEQVDGLRIYCVGDKYISCRRNSSNQFVKYDIKNISPINFKSDLMLPIEKKDVEGTTLSYYYNVINKMDECAKSFGLLTFIKNPKIEAIAKLGFNGVISQVISKTYLGNARDVDKNICDYLTANPRESNPLKSLGLNSKQVAYLSSDRFKNAIIEDFLVGTIKTVLHADVVYKQSCLIDISSIDQSTFEKVADCMLQCSKEHGRYSNDCNNVVEICCKLKSVNMTLYKNFINLYLEKLVECRKQNSYVIREYSDYINMVSLLEGFNRYKLSFNTAEDVTEMHDIVTSVYNLKRNEIRAKAFKEAIKKVEGYEYSTKTDKFAVVIPKTADDVANEGIELHHCVKSYIPKIAEGRTNIVFIRKVDDLEKPFFTVEVSNEKSIEQVHGFGNRNANTEPGLTEFVKKWAKAKKLKINGINKVR